MTKIIDFKKEITDEIKVVGKALRDGKLVIFPTETVYGIGANALDSKACDDIFIAKGRAQDNPLIVHVAEYEDILKYVEDINPIEQRLIDAFMPGPFTLILKKKDIIPNNVSANLNTVGIRMPDNKIAHDIIKEANVPIAAPSANLSGKPSGTRIEDITHEFDGKVEYIVDGGSAKVGLESTVVKNQEAIAKIIKYAMDLGVTYLAFNFPIDTCLSCGYSGEIDQDECPMCKSDKIERLRRVTGYLTTDYHKFNKGKISEVHDRVKHSKYTDDEELY